MSRFFANGSDSESESSEEEIQATNFNKASAFVSTAQMWDMHYPLDFL